MTKFNPPHYQHGRIQVWDFIVDQQLDFLALAERIRSLRSTTLGKLNNTLTKKS
jgi:hypothetical protein